MKFLNVVTSCTIDDDMMTQLLDQVKHIEQFELNAHHSDYNLDYLFNLKLLSLRGIITQDFNYELFKNICCQLEEVNIALVNVDEKKLLDGYNFPYVKNFAIRRSNIKRLNKKSIINRFPFLRQLFILQCNLEEIEPGAFSNIKQLECLDLSQNRLKFIEKDTFLSLKNLQTLDLSKNELTYLNAEFSGVRNSAEIILENIKFGTIRRYFIWH